MVRTSFQKKNTSNLSENDLAFAQAKLTGELLAQYSEKVEIGPIIGAAGQSVGTLTFIYVTPNNKRYLINVRHLEKKSFVVSLVHDDVSLNFKTQFKDIRGKFHVLIQFLKNL